MKGRKRFYLLMLATSMACSTMNVRDEVLTEDFVLADYKTFNFRATDIKADPHISFSEEVSELKNAIKKQLLFRGITQDYEDPDLYVDLSGTINEKIQTRQTDIISDPPRYMGQRRYTWKVDTVEVGRYLEGTFRIVLQDSELEKPVWSGIIEGILPSKEGKRRKIYYQSIQELFKDKTGELTLNSSIK